MFDVFVVDDLPPEAVAMLQALYSRSPKSVREHLEKVRAEGPEKFMSTYYVGYGHKSIGDCGSTSIFIEKVSMLVAKAIQDWPLYSGQEASTRYLDMASQEFLNPLGTADGQDIQDRWRAFYSRVLEELVPELKTRFPIQPEQNETVYNKAIKARAFDIARGFLPAGATTFVSWHSNLRQAADHLKELRYHPLQEVQEVSEKVLEALKAQYPASFGHREPSPEETLYLARVASHAAYYHEPPATDFQYVTDLTPDKLLEQKWLLESRPPRVELPHRLRKYGNITFRFPLDFGSYRDLQRQRSCVQEMPVLSTNYGFYPWYLEQLPIGLRGEAREFLFDQEMRISQLRCGQLPRQYYVGMGYTIAVDMTCSLPSAVYIAELRSSDSVHPTLRVQAQRMGDAILEILPGIAMHHDRSPGTWNIKRGHHDIVRVER